MMSLYEGEAPSRDDYVQITNRLSVAFPRMTKEFFVLLTEYIRKARFTRERLLEAVDYVIANFQYKELNVSDIVSFDKRVRLYTYNEVIAMLGKGYKFEDFEVREVDGYVFRVLKTDLIK